MMQTRLVGVLVKRPLIIVDQLSRGMGKERHKLRNQYLRKFPLIRKQDDGSVVVEGVSNKAMPCPVAWKEPKHVLRRLPDEHGSGDLGDLVSLARAKTVDYSQPKLTFDGSKELKVAPDEVKRVLSLAFGRRRDITARIKDEVIKRVQEHQHDNDSLAVVIAGMTVKIRSLQIALEELNKKPLPPGRLHKYLNPAQAHKCKILIDHRRSLLEKLRQRDYKKFEWLLEQLNLVYKPRPGEYWEKIDRRIHQKRLTELWCDEFRTYKLDKYKQELEKQQPNFLRKKAEVLRWILKEEKELGVKETEESDIIEALKKAKEIEEANKLMVYDKRKKYHIFNESDVVKEDNVYIS